MVEQNYALLDASGAVINVIVADKDYIDNLPKLIADSTIDTGPLQFAEAVNITGKRVMIGHIRGADGTFSPRKPTQAELDAQAASAAAIAQRAAEDARILILRNKTGPGNPGLSPSERDELNLLLLSRTITPV